jgi:cytochrome c-type biogenesis protein
VAGSVAFVVGFALVFVSFGALFGSLGRTLSLHQRGLEECFGVVTIVLGLFFAGWWPSKWLSRERRSHRLPRTTVLGAGLLGILFALGWTPCIGPTLGAILGLASSTSGASAARGSMLAFVYCLGLGLPFIVAALASEWFMTASGWLRRHAGVIGVLGGIMLISIGVAEITGWWASWILWLKTQSWAQSSSSWL